ncbi:MAG TPA: hypothetical protein VJ044_05935 [Candidatus Hodarchaeales archaeon]|nr:hypothetical protein [Candidatus Hodarchaeales archaeon]
MKPFLLLILALTLTACGSGSAGEGGVLLHQQYTVQMKEDFAKVEECTQLKGEPFETLHIEVHPYDFKCQWGSGFCSGEFREPNRIDISLTMSARHEFIHKILFDNTGDSDPDHKSPLFKQCQFVQ